MTYLLLFIALTSNAVANILLKLSAQQFADGLRVLFRQPSVLFSNVYLFCGLFFFALSLVLYAQVLARMNLSVAYPIMTSFGFLIVVGYSVIAFREQLYWWQWFGVAFILLGVILLSQGK